MKKGMKEMEVGRTTTGRILRELESFRFGARSTPAHVVGPCIGPSDSCWALVAPVIPWWASTFPRMVCPATRWVPVLSSTTEISKIYLLKNISLFTKLSKIYPATPTLVEG
jgi:hypothetical protein